MCDDGCDVASVVVSQTKDNDFFLLALGDYLHFVVFVCGGLCVFLCLEFGRCDDIDCFDGSKRKCDCFFPVRCDGV